MSEIIEEQLTQDTISIGSLPIGGVPVPDLQLPGFSDPFSELMQRPYTPAQPPSPLQELLQKPMTPSPLEELLRRPSLPEITVTAASAAATAAAAGAALFTGAIGAGIGAMFDYAARPNPRDRLQPAPALSPPGSPPPDLPLPEIVPEPLPFAPEITVTGTRPEPVIPFLPFDWASTGLGSGLFPSLRTAPAGPAPARGSSPSKLTTPAGAPPSIPVNPGSSVLTQPNPFVSPLPSPKSGGVPVYPPLTRADSAGVPSSPGSQARKRTQVVPVGICPSERSTKDKEKFGCRQGYFRETSTGITYITWSTRKCPSSKTSSPSRRAPLRPIF